MSGKIAVKTVTPQLTEKFKNDLGKFFMWAVKNEYLIKDDNSEIEWSMDLLKTIEFTEPGRNKLDSFIKAVKDTYTIENETGEVDDAKLLAKEFKDAPKEKSPRKKKVDSETETKPKKVKKAVVETVEESETEEAPKKLKKAKAVVEETETTPKKVKKAKAVVEESEVEEIEVVEKPKKVKKTKAVVEKEAPKKVKKAKAVVEKSEVEEVVEKPKKVKKTKEPENENETETVKLDMTLDTENTDWLDVLGYWTNDLIKAFGKPHKTGGKKGDNHTFEWKLEINGGVYSVYDWDNTDSFEDTTWHIATHTESKSENKENMKVLYDYINSMLPEEDTKLDFENLESESESDGEDEASDESEDEN